jgi:lysophospholipase L1-like esterase
MKKKWFIIAISVLVVLALGTGLYFGVLKPRQEKAQWDKMVAQYREAKFAQYQQENAQYGDYEVEVAFLGDSLTDGYDLKKYYPQYITANRGIGGDTTFDLQARLQLSVYDLKPQVAVMLIGANNQETMLQNYEDILIGLKTNLPQTKIVLLSLTAMGGDHWGPKNPMATYNNVSIKLLAEKYGFTYVDLFTPLYDVSIGEVYAGYTIDGGHFTHEGYTVITSLLTPVLKDLLGK